MHQWNALQAGGGTFRLVDPDGLLAEPERVSTGLLCTRIELQPVGREMLAAAEKVAE